METNNDRNAATGNKQSAYAGTNPNRYDAPAPANDQDNPMADEEAQNVNDGSERLSGEEAEHARNKATEGIKQGRDA